MNTLWAIAILAGSLTHAEGNGAPAGEQVPVCIESISSTIISVTLAQGIVSRMFADTGVQFDWRNARSCAPVMEQAILVSFSLQTRDNDHPGALAYSQPFEGHHIRIYYDRVRRMLPSGNFEILLAHVLAHEIGHMLEGTDRHSAAGVMKARWGDQDYALMSRSPLRFTEADIRLIQLGVRYRRAWLAAAGNGVMARR